MYAKNASNGVSSERERENEKARVRGEMEKWDKQFAGNADFFSTWVA